MLEALKELIPLLEGVKDGAVWLVAAYFGVLVLKILAWTGFASAVAVMAYRLIGSSISQAGIETLSWYTFRYRDIGCNLLVEKSKLRALLAEISNDRGYIHDEEIDAAIEKLRK